jgi:two-component system catabolic regulation response regulator CreB
MRPRILVVEDEPSICENILYALENDGFDARSVATGGGALEQVRHGGCDLLVLDVGLPDMTGFEVCREVRKDRSLPILFLTARSGEIDRVVGLEIGGDDYVVKPFSPRELVARVRALLRRAKGAFTTDTQPAPAAPILIDDQRCIVRYFGVGLSLSRYEFRMLKLFAAHPGRVFSRDQLMEAASDEPEAAMERTVDTHIKTLRGHMRAVRPDIDPIVTHRGIGYSLREHWPEAEKP